MTSSLDAIDVSPGISQTVSAFQAIAAAGVSAARKGAVREVRTFATRYVVLSWAQQMHVRLLVERVTRSTAPVLSSDVRPPRFHRAQARHKPGDPHLSARKFKAIRSTLRKFRATLVDVVDCIGNNTNTMSDMDLMEMVNHIVAWNDQIESSSS